MATNIRTARKIRTPATTIKNKPTPQSINMEKVVAPDSNHGDLVEHHEPEVPSKEVTADTIQAIKERLTSLNADADKITTAALSNAKASDLTQHHEILITAMMAIKEVTGANQPDDEGMLAGFWNKVGSRVGIIKQLKQSNEQKYLENASLQENIDSIFTSLEVSIEATEADMDTLDALQKSLEGSVLVGNELAEEISDLIASLEQDSATAYTRSKLDGLLREIKSINLINANTAGQINAQVTTTSGMAQNMSEVKPVLRNLIHSQTLVSLQNARMDAATQVREVISDVVNGMVVTNNAKTQETILDAVRYSGQSVIDETTITELGTQHNDFVAQLTHIAKDMAIKKLQYTKTVDVVTKQLNKGLSDLPQLMIGETPDDK